ncbi:hypothetical protein XO10_03935 [Marinitoga sp. 1135]|nr:hypothetical protein LN42_04370 [Marinitoga sp. 1137]NUU95470.1 hypothetical protein [Marinitoga sp. 1135]NUU97399.1 hypothetical protein [Marinitoga sp. 1138]
MLRVLEKYEIFLNENSYKKLESFIELIINYPVNLTAIKDKEEASKHLIIDSIFPFEKYYQLKDNMKMIDIGTGGGIPGIPLSIIYNNVDFTLLDSIEKKINAVKYFIKTLNINNANSVNSRVELFSKEHREEYDYATAKAVSRSDILLEYAAPLLKIGGMLFLYKGPTYITEEKKYLEIAAEKIGFKIEKEINYQLFDKERYFIILKKEIETPKKYPRKVGMAVRKPLGGIL